MDSLENYRENLHHVVRPEESYDRLDSPHVVLTDYEALVLCHALREFAAYQAKSQEHTAIALSWIEYINMVVRDEGSTMVRIYAHTEEAQAVYMAALANSPNDLPLSVTDDLMDKEPTWTL